MKPTLTKSQALEASVRGIAIEFLMGSDALVKNTIRPRSIIRVGKGIHVSQPPKSQVPDAKDAMIEALEKEVRATRDSIRYTRFLKFKKERGL